MTGDEPDAKAILPKRGASRKQIPISNGQLALFVNDKGETANESPAVYGSALSFDVTAAIKPGADNQITIKGTRTFINELGTGALLGPVYLYSEK